MPTVTPWVGINANDGYWTEGNEYFQSTADNAVHCGWWGGGYGALNSFFRFTLNVPQGAIIEAAALILTGNGGTTGDSVVTRLSAVDADNAAAPTSYAEAEGATRTSAYTDWQITDTWVRYTDYSSPDIAAVVQQVVDRPGWVSGNAITIYWEYAGEDLGATDAYRTAFDARFGYSAQLTVTYSEAAVESVRVAASGDDGDWCDNPADPLFATGYSSIYCGWSDSTYQAMTTFLRFALDVPQGATITAATVTLTGYSTYGGAIATRLQAVAADDAPAPTSYAEAVAASLTTAYADWQIDDAWANNTTYPSSDLSAVIQEIVSRPGWEAGNHIVLYWLYAGEDIGDEMLYRAIYAYDGGSAKAALLSVTYDDTGIYHVLSDTGAGSEAITIDKSLVLEDTGAGEDFGAMHLSVMDGGAGADALAIDHVAALTDTGSGADAITVDKALTLADSGAGEDGLREARGDFATLSQHPHKARLYLAVKQPRIVWAGTVAASRDGEDDLTITTTDGANVGSYDVADFLPDLTAYVGTTPGLHDHGKCRVRSVDGTTLTVSADMGCVWKAGDTVSITDLHELWLRPSRTEVDGDEVTFYKDTDLDVTERAEYPVPIMGCDAAAFRDADTGEATLRFDGSLSYKVQPNSDPYGGPGGLGWDNQGIASYSWWFEGGTPSTSSDPAPVVTYDAAYPNGVTVRLEVTDRDGLTFRGFRNVFIFDRTGDDAPLTDIGIKRLGGSLANHGWEAELELFGESLDPDVLPEGARALLFAEEWFGDTYGSIPMGHGAITRRENVKMQGWLQDTKVVQDQSGVVSASATLRGLQRYLERAASFEVYWTQVDDTVDDWVYFDPANPPEGTGGLTVRKAIYHLIQWHYTLIGLADVLIPDDHNNYLAGHTFPGGHLGTQLDSFVKRIQAQWAADKTGALHVFSWPNWLPVTGDGQIWRTVLYQDVTFTTADFERAEIAPRLKEPVAAVRVEGTIADGTGYNAWAVDIAPGNSKGFKGSQLTVGQQILGTGGGVGTQGYELALLRYVEESRREEKVVFPMTGNYSCFDIIPSTGYFRVTLQPARFRGFSWLAKPFWVTGLDLDVDTENGAIGATIEAFPETYPAGDYDIWSDSGEVGFEGQDDPIERSGAFADLLDTMEQPQSEWVPALMGDGTSHVEGAEAGTSIVRLWGDPNRAVLADNRLFKAVQDRPVVVEVVYNDSVAGRAGAPTYRVVAVDTAKDATADTNEARGYQYHRGVLTYGGTAYVGTALASVALPVEGEGVQLIGAAAYAKTAPTGADLVVALTVNGTVRATVTVAAGANRGVVSVTPLSLAIGDVLDFNVTQVGSTLPGANLTVTAITREFGM